MKKYLIIGIMALSIFGEFNASLFDRNSYTSNNLKAGLLGGIGLLGCVGIAKAWVSFNDWRRALHSARTDYYQVFGEYTSLWSPKEIRKKIDERFEVLNTISCRQHYSWCHFFQPYEKRQVMRIAEELKKQRSLYIKLFKKSPSLRWDSDDIRKRIAEEENRLLSLPTSASRANLT